MKALLWLLAAAAAAQTQAPPKQVPPAGIELRAGDRAELEAALQHLRASIQPLARHPLVADVLIYQEAVRYALQYNEFFKADEIAKARTLLEQGEQRAAQLKQGQAPWTQSPGLIVRGYISKIDRSVQPYGLVIPASYTAAGAHRWRLDTWFHGRSENLNEINFLTDRQRSQGEFAPRDAIVLHLYGRYCNASKFAGEVDLFEALDAVKRNYPIDENRILVRGFSMGGASAWHIGAHFAGLWAAVAPGAGFSESVEYLKLRLDGPDAPPSWEQKLFHLYNATDYAANLYNTASVAYNGDLDPQKQAADMMERAMSAEGMRLLRIVGPQTQHKYHPDSKTEIAARLDAIAARGRDPYPRKLRFTTWTLAYNRMKWVVLDTLEKHWDRARLNAEIASDGFTVETANVAAFTLDFGPAGYPFDLASQPHVAIDGQKIAGPAPLSDRSWTAHFRKQQGRWTLAASPVFPGLHKRHGLQGPIDDAFLDSFIFVTPTAVPMLPSVASWTAAEEKRAIAEWRKQFRGEPQVRDDTQITSDDIASSNLVLWGDPSSNTVLAKIIARLPVTWTRDVLVVGGNRYPAATHVPVLVFPNPLNPAKYVVLNSSFTFADSAARSNATQTPKLPDYAVVNTASTEGYPRRIVLAGFFDEDWGLAAPVR